MPSSSLTRQQQADLTQQLRVLAASRQRQLIWLQGSAAWAGVLANQLIDSLSLAHPKKTVTGLEITTQLPAASQAQAAEISRPLTALKQITSNQARHYLGHENNCLVFNAVNGLNPNALGALAGTLIAGGLIILVTPTAEPNKASPDYLSLSSWPLSWAELSFHFDLRLYRLIAAYQPLIFKEDQAPVLHSVAALNSPAVLTPKAKTTSPSLNNPDVYGALTPCQSKAVSQLLVWFNQKKPQPLVITAHRGRGKSGALGLFLRQLILNKQLENKRVIITAPNPAATFALMQRLEEFTAQELAAIQFVAPDALLAELPSAHLLLIDEAAALPVPVLKALVKNYPTSLFATTQAGYEGNGRGFALRFKEYLAANYPKLQQIELHQPLRWAEDCPLEKLINQLLLLDAQLASPTLNPNAPLLRAVSLQEQLSFRWVSQAELATNEEMLEKIMALLVLAHYRTSPNNLRQLLDAPKQNLLVAWLNQQPIGLVLVQEEGGFPADLAEQIYLGKRRPQGHLLAQSLAFHAGFAKAAEASYWRIQRILVHPRVQRLGVGSLLVKTVEEAAQQEEKLDFLGSSFGATPELANFWFKLGYLPVRLGLTANQASGELTLQLLKPLTQRPAITELTALLRQRFTEVFIHGLGANFSQINPALALCLLRVNQENSLTLTTADLQELKAFCQGARPLVLTHTAIKSWLFAHLNSKADASLELALQFSLQNKTPADLCKRLGLNSKKALEEVFKLACC